MRIFRVVEQNVNNFEIGDIISFTLTTGEEVRAIAVRRIADKMLFCSMDCLAKEYPMDCLDNDKNYLSSELRNALNREILSSFPNEIKKYMVEFSNGDYLRIPSIEEIFGADIHLNKERESWQWEPMKIRRNRIASKGNNGSSERYWLMDRVPFSHSLFYCVRTDGALRTDAASATRGVRFVFIMNSRDCEFV